MSEQGPSGPFRHIAPGTRPPPAPSPEGKRSRALTACTECKKYRRKCTADSDGIPCSQCKHHNRECVLDEYADKRRKISAINTIEEKDYYRGALTTILEGIRDDRTRERTVEAIRGEASLEEVTSMLKENIPTKE